MAAKRGVVSCVACGSAQVRSARTNGLWERFLTLFGYYAFRCQDCRTRFRIRPLAFGSWIYARCPRCLRMDLSVWDPNHYRAGRWMESKAFLGANRWRCEACRCNFVSCRPRKEKYVRPEFEQPTGEQSSDYQELHDR